MLLLKQVRLSKNISASELSRLSGVPLRTIQDLEKRGDGRISTLCLLAKALQVSLDELYQAEE